MTNITRRRFIRQTGALAGAAAWSPGLLATAARAAETDLPLAFKTATELAAMVRAKEIGSVELSRYFIDRIEKYDETLNAVVVRDFERALDQAEAADKALASGATPGPLHGLPMTIKESYNIAGLATTWGRPDAARNIARSDATVVTRFKKAGAHFLGKTNVPIDLGDFQSYNEVYGTTRNPWNPERTPGGSSGGTAVALASGMTGLDSGSDIGGSIRNPAHFCGIYGHKPTLGIVPVNGHAPPGVPPIPQDPDLAVVGPLARSAGDLALALEIVSGPNALTAPGWRLDLPEPRMTSLEGLRVALWPDDPTAPVASEMADRVSIIGERLTKLGAKVSDRERPAFSAANAHEVYMALLLSVTGGPGGNIDHQTWIGLNGRRGGFRLQWQAFFRDWDILLCPITATEAFPHDHSPTLTRTLAIDGVERPYFEQVFWAGLATLSYLPSTVFPTGLSRAGLPIGLQAIGAEFDDRTTIEFARLMEREMGGFVPPPGYEA